MSKKPVVCFVSFGKDSLTLSDLLIRNKVPVDKFVFSDTLMEFPTMYEYAEKIIAYYKQRYGVEIEVLTPETTFESWCFGVMKKGERIGQIRGVPSPVDPKCWWRREVKMNYPDKVLGRDIIKLFGYTHGETRSVDGGYAPLREKFVVGGGRV
jgi:3'-phosphoadenosine 5'-phosphosulfate sulfotransferase (PAPS reductase)/FAD synthetase